MATVVTHSGRFHADEVLACAILHKVLDGGVTEIIRTRITQVIEKQHADEGAFIVDVGGKYEPDNRLFDHHQSDCNETFDQNESVPLSSCGLVYKRYGYTLIREVIDKLNQACTYEPGFPLNVEDITFDLYKQVYYQCIREFDAHDNGIEVQHVTTREEQVKTWFRREKKVQVQRPFPQYNHFGAFISRYNTRDTTDDPKQLAAFKKAVVYAKHNLLCHIKMLIRNHAAYLDAFERVRVVWENLAPSERHIIVFDKAFNYARALKEFDTNDEVCFVVCPREQGKQWEVRTIRKKGTQFGIKVRLLTQADAKQIIGDDKVVFVHKNRFLGVCTDQESAKYLAFYSHDAFTNNKTKRSVSWGKRIVIGAAFVVLLVGSTIGGSHVWKKKRQHYSHHHHD